MDGPIPQRRAIVLVVDRWSAPYSGPYGNTWLETPALNLLASMAMVGEQMLVDSVDLIAQYDAMWRGSVGGGRRLRGSIENHDDGTGLTSIPTWLAESELETLLVTDESKVIGHPVASDFSDVIDLAGRANRDAYDVCSDPADTGIARVVAGTVEGLLERAPALTWVHLRAMEGPWDAPLEYRMQFADDDDPDPPAVSLPPTGQVPENADPDLLQGWVWAYAGQVALLDEFLGPVIEYWEACPEPTLLLIVGARGMELGEHGYWGDATRLFSTTAQVPLFVGSNDGALARIRLQPLVQSRQIYSTLQHWYTGDSNPRSLIDIVDRDYDQSFRGHCLALTTGLDAGKFGNDSPPPWLLRTPVWSGAFAAPSDAHSGSGWQVFLKPDDTWEVNDVADLRPDVVTAFAGIRERILRGESIGVPADVLLARPD